MRYLLIVILVISTVSCRRKSDGCTRCITYKWTAANSSASNFYNLPIKDTAFCNQANDSAIHQYVLAHTLRQRSTTTVGDLRTECN